MLAQMQQSHFWYLGRHRFLYQALRDHREACGFQGGPARAVDLGGGCGGWVRYLQERFPRGFTQIALADSSIQALTLAGNTAAEGCWFCLLGWGD